MKVLVLFLRYGTEKYPNSLSRLRDFYRRHSWMSPHIVIIENSEIVNLFSASGEKVIVGDNTLSEFSGWQSAINRFDTVGYDLIHFVTSAFEQIYDGYLDHYSESPLRYVAASKSCLGHVDIFPEKCTLCGDDFQSWVRTSFFFMSPQTVSDLGGVVAKSKQELDLYFSPTGESPFSKPEVLSKNYRELLINWLTGVPISGVAWHSKIGLDLENRQTFIRKCQSIFLESSLSIKMQKNSVSILDIGYLWALNINSDFEKITDSYTQASIRKGLIQGS